MKKEIILAKLTKVYRKEKGQVYLIVVTNMKAIAKMDKQKGKEASNGIMEIDMKANIKMIERMAKGFIFIIMVIDMKENGNKE